jgi:Cft2 family RNA processing exonuclease
MTLTFQPLGGALEVGANCFVLSDGHRSVLLDAGLHPKKEGREALPDFAAIQGPQPLSLILTHAHHDHLGGVPVAMEHWPRMKALTSEANRIISLRMLKNFVQVMKRRKEEDPKADVLYTIDQLDDVARRMNALEFDTRYSLSGAISRGGTAPSFRIYPAGHVVGAVGVSLDWNGHHVFFTGDLNMRPQGHTWGAELPGSCDTLIMEGTLGSSPELDTLDRAAEETRFAEAARARLAQGGSVIVPCFALGRTQEMLLSVHRLQQEGRLPSVPVFIGGLGRAINEIYDATRFLYPRRDVFTLLEGTGAIVVPRDLLASDTPFAQPAIYLVTSGMLQKGTPSFTLAQRALTDARHGLFWVGYCDHEADGYPLYEARTGDTIRWSGHPAPVRIECQIEKFRFTAHALRSDLLDVVRRMQPQKVILVHGSPASLESLHASIREEFPWIEAHVAWPRRILTLQGAS